jgi:hypothetical protein
LRGKIFCSACSVISISTSTRFAMTNCTDIGAEETAREQASRIHPALAKTLGRPWENFALGWGSDLDWRLSPKWLLKWEPEN